MYMEQNVFPLSPSSRLNNMSANSNTLQYFESAFGLGFEPNCLDLTGRRLNQLSYPNINIFIESSPRIKLGYEL